MSDSAPLSVHERVRARRKQEYRRAILDAAQQVLGSAGYRAAKMSDIARLAGVATGTLYNYFDSKEAVFTALVGRVHDEMFDRLRAVEPGAVGLARVRALVRETLAVIDERGQLFAMQLEAVATAESVRALDLEAQHRTYAVYMELIQGAITRAIERGELRSDVGAQALAFSLVGSIRAFLIDWMLGGCTKPIGDQADLILELFEKGAQPG